ncbi:MAG TPA: pentapeptide repeat-containing protein [Kamptonema sp.]|nr:pentapeptide repeat-containing protein [Kamptonema sp.]
MANPTVSSDINQPDPSWQVSRELPLTVRRCGAWVVEVSLIVASSLVPFTIGTLANNATKSVPLNPVVAATSEAIAQTLAIPIRDRNPRVAPLTNLFWSGALIAPIAVAGWQLYLLAKKGQTSPKRWFGVKVVSESGTSPGIVRALARESLGRWGLPLGIAYTLWRFTGAFPDLVILAGISSLMMLGDGMAAGFDPKRRAGHDRLGRTLVKDARSLPRPNPFIGEDWTDEDAAIAAIVLTPETPADGSRGLWAWMRQHPGFTLLTVTILGMTSVLGTFIGTQVYIQSQANLRDFKQRDDEVFLALVNKLSPTSPNGIAERRAAILALGAVEDSRAVPLLADLLGQEENRTLVDSIQQALVSAGTKALPYLQRLNQALSNDLDSLRYGGNAKERELTNIRQRATQRAIAKILTVYRGQVNDVDLSRTDLSQTVSGPAQFTLVLEKADLSGISLRSANLTNAILPGVRFYGAGKDGRFGTFDDWIADLSGANFESANLTGAFLSNVMMNRTNFLRATLNKANLSNGNLSGANFSSALLIGADLRQALLKDASFTGADLGSANLSGANLENARFGQAKAQGAQLQRTNLIKSDWQGADLSGADLSQANLRNADLSSVKLASANLSNTQLQDANFRNADVSLVNFRGANIAGANFKGATFVSTKQNRPDQFIQSPAVASKSGRLQGVDFTDVKNLEASQIAYICLQGGIHPRCPQKN